MSTNVNQTTIPLDDLAENGVGAVTVSEVIIHTVPPKKSGARLPFHKVFLRLGNNNVAARTVTLKLERQSGKRLPAFSVSTTVMLGGNSANAEDTRDFNGLIGEDVELSVIADATGTIYGGWVEIV